MIVRPFLFALSVLFAAVWSLPANAVPDSARSREAVKRVTPGLTKALSEKDLKLGAQVFIQIIKQSNELHLYLDKGDGTYGLFKTYPICSWSGELGPKQKEGDGQSPEGFYTIKPGQMHPTSSFHLSFNLGFPNAYDRAKGRTGSYLMVHGNCVSIGCYAMTDTGIEEIWTLMTAAYEAGQPAIPVHAFPFAMTEENLAAYKDNQWSDFWSELEPAWRKFQVNKTPPSIRISNGRYVIRD